VARKINSAANNGNTLRKRLLTVIWNSGVLRTRSTGILLREYRPPRLDLKELENAFAIRRKKKTRSYIRTANVKRKVGHRRVRVEKIRPRASRVSRVNHQRRENYPSLRRQTIFREIG